MNKISIIALAVAVSLACVPASAATNNNGQLTAAQQAQQGKTGSATSNIVHAGQPVSGAGTLGSSLGGTTGSTPLTNTTSQTKHHSKPK